MAEELRIEERPELERPVLVGAFRGWNDGAQGASLAAGYLAKQWDAQQTSAWQTIQRSHAIANGVYVASVNRIGHEGAKGGGIEFFGSSFICDPYGRMIAEASSDKAEVLVAEVDPKVVETARQHWPFLRDRRIDAYGAITERSLEKR